MGFETQDEGEIRASPAAEGWTLDQIEGQLGAIVALAASETGFVAVGDEDSRFAGYVSAQFYG